MCFPLEESKLPNPIIFIISFSSSVLPSRSFAVIAGLSRRNLGTAPVPWSPFSLRSLLLDLRLGERERLLGDRLRLRRGDLFRGLGDEEQDRDLRRSLAGLRSLSRSRSASLSRMGSRAMSRVASRILSHSRSRDFDLLLWRSRLCGDRERLLPMTANNFLLEHDRALEPCGPVPRATVGFDHGKHGLHCL